MLLLRQLFLSLVTLSFCVSPLLAQEQELPAAPEGLEEPVPGEPAYPEYEPPAFQDYSFTEEFMSMMSTLGLILLGLLVMAYFVKRMKNVRTAQLNDSSTIKILDQRSISPKGILYLVEVMGQLMVVSESPSGIHHLSTLSGSSEPSNTSFKEIMERGE